MKNLIALSALCMMAGVAGCDDAATPVAPEPATLALADLAIEPDPVLIDRPLAVLFPPIPFRAVSAGQYHSCGVRDTTGVAYCWGNNYYGQVGDGTVTRRRSPVAVSGSLVFRQVSAGANHSCGVTTANLAYCWGANDYGQLGNGTSDIDPHSTPVPVAGGLAFRSISAGEGHSCGITTASQAYCWGDNYSGQLGDGTTTDRLTPVPVAGGLQLGLVSAGGQHSCALTWSTNLAYCWGGNVKGQLGDGTTTRRLTPVAVAGGRQFRSISAGWAHSCAAGLSSASYCWGYNAYGQLGDGTNTSRSLPGFVVGSSGAYSFRDIDAGFGHSCGVLPVSSLAYCWGWNGNGQLGDGTTIDRTSPVQLAGGLTLRVPSAGGTHSCATTVTSTRAYCWGFNGDGQVGDGTTTLMRLTPAPVAP